MKLAEYDTRILSLKCALANSVLQKLQCTKKKLNKNMISEVNAKGIYLLIYLISLRSHSLLSLDMYLEFWELLQKLLHRFRAGSHRLLIYKQRHYSLPSVFYNPVYHNEDVCLIKAILVHTFFPLHCKYRRLEITALANKQKLPISVM